MNEIVQAILYLTFLLIGVAVGREIRAKHIKDLAYKIIRHDTEEMEAIIPEE